jgi:hypothetical protein
MTLELCEIYFDHQKITGRGRPPRSSFYNSALHIRRNQDFEVAWPEYNGKDQVNKPDSLAAYSIVNTTNQDVFIFVRFQKLSNACTSYEIRAEGGGILGELLPTRIDFPSGETSTNACIPLNNRRFEEVGKYAVVWNWFYREESSDTWQFLGTTKHKVYLTYFAPQAPWSAELCNRNNPWTELLEVCCEIAQGASDEMSTLAEITKAINNRYNLKYDIIAGAPRYSWTIYRKGRSVTVFDLRNWINFVLKGNPPSNVLYLPGTKEEYKHFQIVGCQDTAAAVAIMSSVTGVRATVAFHAHFGYLQLVYPIGRDKSNNPYTYLNPNRPTSAIISDSEGQTKFQFHYYVKSGDSIFDSCMRAAIDQPENEGWLVNVSQLEYEESTIDRSTSLQRELNCVRAANGTFHPSRPEPIDLEILLT